MKVTPQVNTTKKKKPNKHQRLRLKQKAKRLNAAKEVTKLTNAAKEVTKLTKAEGKSLVTLVKSADIKKKKNKNKNKANLNGVKGKNNELQVNKSPKANKKKDLNTLNKTNSTEDKKDTNNANQSNSQEQTDKKKKKKKKKKNKKKNLDTTQGDENQEKTNGVETAPDTNKSDTTESKDVDTKDTKKSKKPKNKKKRKLSETDTKLVVESENDYSANWKKLQKILDANKSENKKYPKVQENGKVKKIKTKHETKEPTETTEQHVHKPKEKKEKPEIWFDNVDPILLEPEQSEEPMDCSDDTTELSTDTRGSTKQLIKNNSFQGATKIIAMDCEMVGVGFDGKDSNLARVSIVNHFGQVLYDKFVKPIEEVTDYRTEVSGIRPSDLIDGITFSEAQKGVSNLLNGRILVGHALKNDLKCLFLSHPRGKIRDTARFRPFKKLFGGKTPSLRKLTEKLLKIKIQAGEHSSVQDAQAAMRLYTLYRKEWDESIAKRNSRAKSRKPEEKNTETEDQSESD